jgi:hypothetical protein
MPSDCSMPGPIQNRITKAHTHTRVFSARDQASAGSGKSSAFAASADEPLLARIPRAR